MKKLFIALTLLIGIGAHINAQEIKDNKEQRGDKQVFRYDYLKAIDSYTKADELTLDGRRKLAEAYRMTNQNVLAAETYAEIVADSERAIPEDFYNYAMVLKSLGKYDESAIWMDKFQALAPADLRAQSYAANKSELNNMSTHNMNNEVKSLDINTEEQDFATCYYHQSVVFSSTSSRVKMIKRTYNGNGKPFLDMYVAESEAGQLKNQEVFNKKMNDKMHDGPASFNKDATFMAFTRNNEKDRTKDKVVELQIYFSTYADGKWSEEEAFIYNNSEYSVGHPFLTADGETMYFVSNMPGGCGGSDIYKTTKDENGAWGTPENLGNKINTEGDELFPFFEETNSVLIFTSDGHFGLGGMDIFMSPMNGSEFGKVRNAGAPVNTMHDDYAVIYDQETGQGFFSSNRNGADDDIYSVDFTKGLNVGKKIEGLAMDEEGNLLPQTFVTLFDDKGTQIDTLTTLHDGAYAFLVDGDKYFKLVGTKENYLEGNNSTNTFGDAFIVKADLVLPVKKEEVVAEEVAEEIVKPVIIQADFGKFSQFKPIYFDLNRYNIRADAAKQLDELVKVMNENPTMVVTISSFADARDTEDYNQILSNKRAKATLAYIKKRITNPDRISGTGYGETQLVNGCSGEDGEVLVSCSEDQHQKNRRTEFIIVTK